MGVKKPKSARALLCDSKLKVTPSRLALIECLARHHGPFTPEELSGRLEGACDLVTIYRNLATFEKNRIVERCDFGDGVMRYELRESHHHHHHLICRDCGVVKPLNECLLGALEKSLEESGFTNLSHRLEFFGTCPDCVSV